MSRSIHHRYPFHIPRNAMNAAVDKADEILKLEKELIEMLYEIDQHRFFVWFGYKSLMGFCNLGLRFSKTQSQRLVTQVRRYEPTSNMRQKSKQSEIKNVENFE